MISRLFISFLYIGLLACAPNNEADKEAVLSVDSNAEMARVLDSISVNVPPEQAWNSNSIAAKYLLSRMQNASGVQKVQLHFQYANQLLNAGQTAKAIEELKLVIQEFKELGALGANKETKLLYEILGVAYLRLGEEQNCCAMHNPHSCILPIAPEAVHTRREGSESAIAVYMKILRGFPGDQQTVYLLNLAYMTLGEYPEGVPPEYRIAGLGEGNSPPLVSRYRDVAIASKTDIMGLSGGACLDDFNNDGLLDIFASSYGLSDQAQILINTGNGKFENRTQSAGLTGIVSGLNTLQADYNNDGFLDILVLRGAWLGTAGNHPNSLLRNNGDGTFTDVTRQSGIYSMNPTQTAVWRDFNLDGYVDLFIGNESTKSQTKPSELFLNNGDGTFEEIASRAALNVASYVKGCASGDINNDGKPDLYVSIINGDNRLFRNITEPGSQEIRFEEIVHNSNVALPIQSFPCWFWDFDNDGNLDLFVSSYDIGGFDDMAGVFAAELQGKQFESELSKLYKGNGDGTFFDVTSEIGIDKLMFAMGSNFGDINTDGALDFYIGNGAPDFRMVIPNRMFLNQGNGRKFTEVTYEGGFGHIQKGHGVSFGDVDNDGDEDIYCVMGGAVEGDIYQNILYENPTTGASWITLTLQGTESNRSALGARVRIFVTGKRGAQQVIHRDVSTGGSFGGSSLRLEVGLGDASTVNKVEVDWPNRNLTTEIFTNLDINSAYKLVEGANAAEKLLLKTFVFASE